MIQGPKASPVERRFRDLSPGEKLRFVGKACVFFLSGGFVFPTLWID